MLTILATSAASGVIEAVREAAAALGVQSQFVTTSNESADQAAGAVHIPATADPSFGPRLLEIAELVRPDIVVAGRDEDALALGLLATPLASLGAAVTAYGLTALRGSHDKAATELTFGPALKGREQLVRIARTAVDEATAQALLATHGSVIVKPRFGCSSRGVSLVVDPNVLKGCFNTNQVVAQEAIPSAANDARPWDNWRQGSAWGERSYQLAISRSGDLLGAWASVNVLYDGRPIFVDRIQGPLVDAHIEVLHSAFVALGASGIWNAQAKLVDDTAVIFEVNGRMTGITGVRAADGFNELELALAAARGDTKPVAMLRGAAGSGTYDCRKGYPGVPMRLDTLGY